MGCGDANSHNEAWGEAERLEDRRDGEGAETDLCERGAARVEISDLITDWGLREAKRRAARVKAFGRATHASS
jgi:hypothetical protein